MNPKVLIAILHCDRKQHNQMNCLESVYNQDYNNYEIYHNVETVDISFFKQLREYAENQNRIKTWFDFWSYISTWWEPPVFDQDQARLVPICEARNRSIECALNVHADYLLFVDADMIIPKNTITKLMSWDKDMVGGFVRGRNAHKEAIYVFGHEGGINYLDNGLIECDHGNIGFVLIKRKVFSVLRFRRGPHCLKDTFLSDDPNYTFDWLHKWNGQRFYIDKTVEAKHIDETKIPFLNGAQY